MRSRLPLEKASYVSLIITINRVSLCVVCVRVVIVCKTIRGIDIVQVMLEIVLEPITIAYRSQGTKKGICS